MFSVDALGRDAAGQIWVKGSAVPAVPRSMLTGAPVTVMDLACGIVPAFKIVDKPTKE